MYKLPVNIDKRMFWRFINKKINRSINSVHVLSIISILFHEMISDLKDGKDIKIFNFGTLSLIKSKPKNYYDVRFNKVMFSMGKKNLKFKISKKLRYKLIKNIDVDKTFGVIK